MTSPSDYSVKGPEAPHEIARPVPVGHGDDRRRNGSSRRSNRRAAARRGSGGGAAAADSRTEAVHETAAAEARGQAAAAEGPEPESSDHVVDTLA